MRNECGDHLNPLPVELNFKVDALLCFHLVNPQDWSQHEPFAARSRPGSSELHPFFLECWDSILDCVRQMLRITIGSSTRSLFNRECDWNSKANSIQGLCKWHHMYHSQKAFVIFGIISSQPWREIEMIHQFITIHLRWKFHPSAVKWYKPGWKMGWQTLASFWMMSPKWLQGTLEATFRVFLRDSRARLGNVSHCLMVLHCWMVQVSSPIICVFKMLSCSFRIWAKPGTKHPCKGHGQFFSRKFSDYMMKQKPWDICWTLTCLVLFSASLILDIFATSGYLELLSQLVANNDFRKFLVLENVGAILSPKCRDCMDYLLQAVSTFTHGFIDPDCPFSPR